LVCLGQKDKRQALVISQNKKNLFSFFKTSKHQHVLDMIEYKKNSKGAEEIKVKSNKDFPKQFNSENEVQEESKKIELERKVNRVLKELKKTEVKQGESNEIEKEKLISMIKRQLEKNKKNVLEKDELISYQKIQSKLIENKGSSEKSDEFTGKYTVCNLFYLTKEYLSSKKETETKAVVETLPKGNR
jgi:hypothetical protein